MILSVWGGFLYMKRLLSILMILCILLGVYGVASAAKPSITKQPETQTVKKGGTLTFSVEAKNADGGITWHFQNPATGKDYTGRKLSGAVSGLKVTNPNSLNITLKKVPESMHGWTAYCHIGPKNGGVDTDTVMILIEGMDPPATPKPTEKADSSSSGSKSDTSSSSDSKTSSKSGRSDSDSEAMSTPAMPTATPKPEKIVITGNTRIELYKVDSKGEPLGKPQQELTFTDGEADFFVKLPDATEGSIQYVSVDGIRFTPDGEVRGVGIKGWPYSASVKVKVNKPGPDYTPTPTLVLPDETVSPADPSTLVTVTCENCRFTGYKSSYAKSGEVPVGTTITVIASGGMVSKGYFINGAKKATHKNEASFQYVVEGDTTITMEKQK